MPAVDDAELRRLAFAAGDGDALALTQVIGAVRDDVYRLALRMLWHPEDAADATQEVLIRVMTRIDSYRGDAAFRTWVYRVASNHILNWRQGRVERENLTFRRFAEQLHDGLAEPNPSEPDARLLTEEVKLGCTLGMLLCLDREHRLAYVLSDVFSLPSSEAAVICDITPAAFRQRASRARRQVRRFVAVHCGLVNPSASCRCDRRVAAAVRTGRVHPQALRFASHVAPHAAVGEMDELHDLASLMRSHPDYAAPQSVISAVHAIIESGRYKMLQ